MSKLRLVLHAPYAFPLFDPTDTEPVGGIETRAWLFARGLARLPETDVDVVVRAPRWFRQRTFDGIRVWNASDGFDPLRKRVSLWREGRGEVPWRAALLWELPVLAVVKLARELGLRRDLNRLYDEINGDVHICLGVSRQSRDVVREAHARDRPALLCLASDDDLDRQFTAGSQYRTPYGEIGSDCYEALMEADAIVAQSAAQQDLLQARFQREATVIPNPFDLEGWDRAVRQSSAALAKVDAPEYLLWVGRADRFHKRPEIALQLAAQLPDVPFLMILNRGEPLVAEQVRANAPGNVSIIERVPYAEMAAVFARARALLSTSSAEYEGSPNTFLQAAASRVPVLSLEVAGGSLHQSGAGFVARGSLDELTAAIRRAWSDAAWRRECGEAGRSWVQARHDLLAVCGKLRELAAQSCAAAGRGNR